MKGISLLFAFGLIALLTFTEKAFQEAPPKADEPPTLYSNQTRDDLKLLLKNALERAQKSIEIRIFSMTDLSLIKTLREKAAAGIPVHIVYDSRNAYGLKKKVGDQVKAEGRVGIRGIMHRKILIIDEKEIWLGSTNFTPTSLEMYPNLLMALSSQEMAEDIIKETPKPLYHVGGQELELWLLPDPLAEERILQLLQSAQKSIRVAMFTWTHERLTDAILAAKERGIFIEVVIDASTARGVSIGPFERLKQAGIPCRTSMGLGLLHHKFAWIDGEILVHGSTNWTKAAFTRNEDCFVILHNLTTKQKAFMDTLWNATLADSLLEEPIAKLAGPAKLPF